MSKIGLFACSFCGFITTSSLICMFGGEPVSRWTPGSYRYLRWPQVKINPREHDDGLHRCQCDTVSSHKPLACDHPGCEARLCWACATACGASAGCGMFCESHLSEINMGSEKRPCVVHACARCEREVMDESEMEQGSLAA